MAQTEAEDKSWWERADVRVGVIAAAIALLLQVLGLPRDLAAALGRSQADKKTSIELTESMARVKASAPRLEPSYVLMDSDLLGFRSSGGKSRKHPSVLAQSLIDMPVLDNSLVSNGSLNYRSVRPSKGCRSAIARDAVAFLLLANHGARDATEITLDSEVTRLATMLRVTLQADYRELVKTASSRQSAVTTKLPLTLRPGQGVLVPLFVVPLFLKDAWTHRRPLSMCVRSRDVYSPESIKYMDPATGESHSLAIRAMRAPVSLGNGIQGRG